MPATYAHYTFGKKVFDKLDKDKKRIIAENREIYDIGLHGPDLLFFYKPLKKNPINTEGNEIHRRKAYDFFKKNYNLRKKSEKHLAYYYGFLCHFALDRACHLYVYEIQEKGYQHTTIEAEFDRSLLIKDNYNKPQAISLTKHIVPSKENAQLISEFFPGISQEEIYKCLKSFIFYHNILLSPGKLKRGFLNLVFNIFKMPFIKGLLIAHKNHPEFAKYNEELYNRFLLGIDDAINLINEKDGGIEKNKIYSYNFESELKEVK